VVYHHQIDELPLISEPNSIWAGICCLLSGKLINLDYNILVSVAFIIHRFIVILVDGVGEQQVVVLVFLSIDIVACGLYHLPKCCNTIRFVREQMAETNLVEN
jgi:hypothetical protein